MKWGNVGEPGRERPVVISRGGTAFDASGVVARFSGEALRDGGLDRVVDALAANELPVVDIAGQRVGAPLQRPGKIVCVGLNYRQHAIETGADLPIEPVLFLKAPNTVGGPDDTVMIPPGSRKTDWEIELAVVIGQEARYLSSPDVALRYVAGYTISHDVSEREYQLERGGQWDKGKSCETFNPLGPWVVSADEVPDPQSLELRLWVNEELRQDASTADMVFDVAHLVWYVSQFMVLEPGDVINTGTPAGVALGLPHQPFLEDGDHVRLEIAGLGMQQQTFRRA